MASLNRALLIGHLGGDPEVTTLPSGSRVANFSIATARWVKKDNEWEEGKPDWHRCVAWGDLADKCERSLEKGALVFVEGRMDTSPWTDKEGTNHWITKIVASKVLVLKHPGTAISSTEEGNEEGDVPF